jgi:hypothetical protein
MYRPKKSLEDIDWKASENYLFKKKKIDFFLETPSLL